MCAATVAVCIVTALIYITPQTYNIAQGEIAPETITSPRDFVDEAATQRLREEAKAMVGPSYRVDTDISQTVMGRFEQDLNAFEEVRAYAQDAYIQQQNSIKAQVDEGIASANAQNQNSDNEPVPVPTPYIIPEFNPRNVNWIDLLSQEQLELLREKMPEYSLYDDLMTVISMSAEDLTAIRNTVLESVQGELYNGIYADDEKNASSQLSEDISRALRLSLDNELLINRLIQNDLGANLVFDEVKTEAERNNAALQVASVEYKTGENIVEKGNRITTEQYDLLTQLGMVSAETASGLPYYAVVIYIGFVFALYILFLCVFNKRLIRDTKKAAILSILTAVSFVLTAVAHLISVHLFPIILFVILGAVLLSPKNALVYSLFLSLLLTAVTSRDTQLISNLGMISLLTTITGSFFAVYILKDMKMRSRLILAGIVAAVPGVVIELICRLLRIVNLGQFFFNSAIMATSGLICGIAAIGVLPIIETLFKLTTPTKLLELSAPNNPLLSRLMVEAPGTYHHSVIVANLAEAASNAVGGYSLLARTGAYFHDIGKLENPMFFKENQKNNVNPHDELNPWESASVIRRHPSDGVALMKKEGMPPELLEITSDHHGNSLVGYFYAKALETGKEVNEADFRYSAKPPASKEGAIIMLADAVEAAVRSMDNPSKEEIEAVVNKLIKQRYDDGQMDNAPLNRRDLSKIAEAFVNVFSGVYHQRIKYPEIKIHGVMGDEDNVL